MTRVTFLRALGRRAWIVVLCAAMAAVAVGAITLRSQPSYTATATVIAKNPQNATDRPLSFPEVATSNTVAIRAIKAAHVEESVARLDASLSVVSGKSDIYQVAIRDQDPARATALANAVATEATAYYQELAGGDTVSIQATIDQDRADLNKRYLDASQALLTFDQEHPQGAGAKAADPALGARRLALALAQQATANAVLNFEAGITQGKLGQITTIRNFEAHVLDRAAPIPSGGGQGGALPHHAGRRVIVVDADFRRPRLHQLFTTNGHGPHAEGVDGFGQRTEGDSPRVGLAGLIAGTATFAEVAAAVEGFDNMWLIPAGVIPSNPSELLGSEQIRGLVLGLCDRADVVLLDSPPCALYADAVALTEATDGVLYVLKSGPVGVVNHVRILRQLQQGKARLLGIVMNQADAGASARYGAVVLGRRHTAARPGRGAPH